VVPPYSKSPKFHEKKCVPEKFNMGKCPIFQNKSRETCRTICPAKPVIPQGPPMRIIVRFRLHSFLFDVYPDSGHWCPTTKAIKGKAHQHRNAMQCTHSSQSSTGQTTHRSTAAAQQPDILTGYAAATSRAGETRPEASGSPST
jgi:hypothetical protein